jgi:hypothetical protein
MEVSTTKPSKFYNGKMVGHPTGTFNGGGPENNRYSASFLGFQYDFRAGTLQFNPSKSLRLGLQLGLGIELGINSDTADRLSRSNQVCRQQGGS